MRTFFSASARVATRTGSTDSNSRAAYFDASSCWPPTWKDDWPGGTSLTNATFGLSGPRESASPISTEMMIG